MIITQKYNSVNQIDPEFIPSIEELLSDTIPHFETLKNIEKNSPKDLQFIYYLFFGETTNAPIGFARLELKNEKLIKQGFIKRVLKKDPIKEYYQKSVRWQIPGRLKEGIVFNPRYLNHASEKALAVLEEIFKREDILSQEITFSQTYQKIFEYSQSKTTHSLYVPDCLIKTHNSYADFFQSIDHEIQGEIKNCWKTIAHELKIGEYKRLKSAFEYKTKGKEQYKTLKEALAKKYYALDNDQACFLTLENAQEVQLLIIYLAGHHHNAFYDIAYIHEDVNPILIHQLALMQFYQAPAQRLHFMGEGEDERLYELGFTQREQLSLSLSKGQQ